MVRGLNFLMVFHVKTFPMLTIRYNTDYLNQHHMEDTWNAFQLM